MEIWVQIVSIILTFKIGDVFYYKIYELYELIKKIRKCDFFINVIR